MNQEIVNCNAHPIDVVNKTSNKLLKTANQSNQYLMDLKDRIILQEDGRCTNAFNLISDKEILMAAYWKLKSKPGMMTKGSDDETLDGIKTE